VLDERDHVVYTIQKSELHSWTQNWADPTVILPKETFVREIIFTRSVWDIPTKNDLPPGSFTLETSRQQRADAVLVDEILGLRIRAVFEIREDIETIQFDGGTGKLYSEPSCYKLFHTWTE
jgi:hypothetical protein